MEDTSSVPEELFQRLREGFRQVPFNQLVGLKISQMKKDWARMTLPWKPELERSTGNLHGGVIATMLDLAGAAAVSSNLNPDTRRVPSTLSLLINYLEPGGGEDIFSEARVVRRTRSHAFIDARVYTKSGQTLATGSMIYRLG